MGLSNVNPWKIAHSHEAVNIMVAAGGIYPHV